MKTTLDNISVTEAEKTLNEIWESIKPESEKNPDLSEEFNSTFGEFRFYKIVACYFLWKIKTCKNIITATDLSAAYHREVFEMAMLSFDDLCDCYLSYHDEEWKKFHALASKYSVDQLAACILKLNHYDKTYYEEAPKSIERLANGFLNLNAKDKVAEINAEACSYMLNSQELYPNTEFIGIDESYPLMLSGFMKAEVSGYLSMRFANGDFEGNDITKSFVNTIIEPLKINMTRYSPRDAVFYLKDSWHDFPADINDEWSLCADGIARTGFKGKTVAIMNAGELTRKSSIDHRRFLCDRGFIEGVIALPDKMYSRTWVNTYLVIMSPGNDKVRFLDARDEYVPSRIKGKRINDLTDDNIKSVVKNYNDNSIAVSLRQIKDAEYNLNPLRYVTKEDPNVTTVELGSLLKGIKRGISLKASDMDNLISDEESNIKCIRTSQIASGIIEDYSYYHGALKKPEKNSASWGNILISKVGSPFKIAVADTEYLVIGNIYILSIDREKISPEYIKCFLSSNRGQAEIEKLSAGSASPVLNISEVEKIRIPIYKRKKQSEKEQRSEELINELETYYHQIKEAESELAVMFD